MLELIGHVVLKQYPFDKDILLLPHTRRSGHQLFEKRHRDTSGYLEFFLS